jgi:HK97 gp10 family phage protein
MTIEKDRTGEVLRAVERATKVALTAAAVLVHGESVVRCPVDTGNLRSSLDYNVKPDEARVGTNVEYSPYVEYGTVKMAKQPYLRPALDENETKIQRLMAKEYKKAIEGATP